MYVKAKTVYALTPDTTGLDMTAPATVHERYDGNAISRAQEARCRPHRVLSLIFLHQVARALKSARKIHCLLYSSATQTANSRWLSAGRFHLCRRREKSATTPHLTASASLLPCLPFYGGSNSLASQLHKFTRRPSYAWVTFRCFLPIRFPTLSTALYPIPRDIPSLSTPALRSVSSHSNDTNKPAKVSNGLYRFGGRGSLEGEGGSGAARRHGQGGLGANGRGMLRIGSSRGEDMECTVLPAEVGIVQSIAGYETVRLSKIVMPSFQLITASARVLEGTWTV